MNWLSRLPKRLVHSVVEYRRQRHQHPPKFRTMSAAGDRPAIVYYLCPDSNKPSGGIRTIYQHVDALNSIGIEAFVVHHRRGFVCEWFKHQTKVVAASDIALTSKDMLVIPELYIPHIKDIPVGPRVIVFNQAAYHSFVGRQSVPSWRYCVSDSQLEAILVVSLDNEEYIRYTLPGVRTERVRNCIDRQVFYPAVELPCRRIVVMPRRRGRELCSAVLSLLTLRGALDGWEVVNLENSSGEEITPEEIAQVLRSAAIFLSFSEREGFGLPPAEAMACGCYVVGFTGLGGREFFYPGLCVQVEEGNVLALAKATEEAMRNFGSDASAMRELALKASALICDEYSSEKQLCDLRDFFESIGFRPSDRDLQRFTTGEVPGGEARN